MCLVGPGVTYEEYIRRLRQVFRAVFMATVPGGRLVVNATNMTAKGVLTAAEGVPSTRRIYQIVHDIVRVCDDIGYAWTDEITWHKTDVASGFGRSMLGSYPNPGSPIIMNAVFESVVVFRKPGIRPPVDDNAKACLLYTSPSPRD